MTEKRLRALFAALVVLFGIGISVVVVDNGDDHDPTTPRRTTTIHIGPTTKVDNADADAKADDVIPLDPQARAVARTLVARPGDLIADKPGVPPLEGTAPQIQEGIIPFPWAADEIAGCRTRFLRTNFSARGVAPAEVILFELHFTAGPDVPNSRSEVDGLTAFGNQPSARVSWHLNMDKDGNCDYNVPLRMKAWTIAGLNSYTINVEVAGRGEAPYLRPAGYRKLASVIRQVRRAYPGIKVQVGATDGHCHPTRGGIDSHYRGGPCSGGHTDIQPHDIAAVVRRLRAVDAPAPVTATDVVTCRKLNWYRDRVRRHLPTTPTQRSNARHRKAALTSRHLSCTAKGPIRV